jgi:hypothetical protein
MLVMDTLHYCRPMHNDTYSVHDRSLKPWWSRFLCSQTFCYVFSPPLSGLNWFSLSPFGGPGPHIPKVASPLLGSAHTPFPGSRTTKIKALISKCEFLCPICHVWSLWRQVKASFVIINELCLESSLFNFCMSSNNSQESNANHNHSMCQVPFIEGPALVPFQMPRITECIKCQVSTMH